MPSAAPWHGPCRWPRRFFRPVSGRYRLRATSVWVFLCASTPTTTATAGLPIVRCAPHGRRQFGHRAAVPHLVSAAPCGASQTAAARGISQTPGGENQTAATTANILIAQTARDLTTKLAPPHLSHPTWTHLPSEPTRWAARILTSHRAGNQDLATCNGTVSTQGSSIAPIQRSQATSSRAFGSDCRAARTRWTPRMRPLTSERNG